MNFIAAERLIELVVNERRTVRSIIRDLMEGAGWWVSPQGKDFSVEDHSAFLRSNKDLFGITAQVVTTPDALNRGWMRVRIFGREIAIEVKTADKRTLGAAQIFLMKKFKTPPNKDVIWEAGTTFPRQSGRVSFQDFMTASSFREIANGDRIRAGY